MSPEITKANGHKIQGSALRSMPPIERFTPLTPHLAISPTVSVVVPAMNEAENLPHVFATIPQWIDEIVLVDGNSVDDTVAVARRLRPNVKIVTQTGKGKGDALAAGFAACTSDIIVMIDADGSTDGHEIISFVGALVTGADFVKGSRYISGGGSDDLTFSRYFGNKVLTTLVNVFYRTKYTDLCYGYNAFWTRHLPVLDLDCDGFEVETLMNVRAAKAGLRVHEVPSHERCRIHGESNLHAVRDGIRVLKTILRERRRRPTQPVPEPAARPAADRGVA
ncbi:glycosyltransferase family 2 protein [Nonomuraea sp. NPDC059194]|uniref:glycosyltransferase family 2 protein n=1 Tax=Nonomuraea sp. NPDC059194 TaxID=3346764 RepID=UPI00369310B5